MPVQCDELAELLAGAVDGTTVLEGRASRHVGSCLRCQAELAQYRRLLRTLRQLRDEPVLVPADLPALVSARLDAGSGVRRLGGAHSAPWTRRVAYAGALAATAAGAAGAIALVATRSRRVRLAS
jgi:anti-sigma factor RsiW